MANKIRKPKPVAPINGWVLIIPGYDDHKNRYIAWHEIFRRKCDALDFAREYGWTKPYWAVRATLAADEPRP